MKYDVFFFIAIATSIATTLDARERVNPFSNPGYFSKAKSGTNENRAPIALNLKAVMPSSTNALAIINGELLNIGDSINGYALVEVRHSGVQLSRDNEKFILPLSKIQP